MNMPQLYLLQLLASFLLVGSVKAGMEEFSMTESVVGDESSPAEEMVNSDFDFVPQTGSVEFQAVMGRHRAVALVDGVDASHFTGIACEVPMIDDDPNPRGDGSFVASALGLLQAGRAIEHLIELPTCVVDAAPKNICTVVDPSVAAVMPIVIVAGR